MLFKHAATHTLSMNSLRRRSSLSVQKKIMFLEAEMLVRENVYIKLHIPVVYFP